MILPRRMNLTRTLPNYLTTRTQHSYMMHPHTSGYDPHPVYECVLAAWYASMCHGAGRSQCAHHSHKEQIMQWAARSSNCIPCISGFLLNRYPRTLWAKHVLDHDAQPCERSANKTFRHRHNSKGICFQCERLQPTLLNYMYVEFFKTLRMCVCVSIESK